MDPGWTQVHEHTDQTPHDVCIVLAGCGSWRLQNEGASSFRERPMVADNTGWSLESEVCAWVVPAGGAAWRLPPVQVLA